MKKMLFAVSLLGLVAAGCEQAKPPTPEGLRKIKARTAKGTVFTKLEARSQPEKPLSGQVSIWDLKVFNIKDKPDGTREEWKFFDQLPQPAGEANTTGVLMNAWLVSKDGSVFLPVRPSYKEYGSFVTDWTIPRPGPYTLYVEYHPAQSGPKLPTEIAHWDFSADPGPDKGKPLSGQPHWTPSQNPAPITQNGLADGEPAGTLSFDDLPANAGDKSVVTINKLPAGATGLELAGVTAGGDFRHFTSVGPNKFDVSFPDSSMVRIWAYFSLNGTPYAAHITRFLGIRSAI